MLKSKGIALFIIVFLVVVAFLLPACSSGTPATSAAPPTQGQTTTQPPTTAVASTQAKVIRFSVPLPDQDTMVQSIIQAAGDFNKAAAGKYEMKVFAGGVLAGMLEAVDMVQKGAIESCDFAPDFFSEKDLRFGAQGVPFAFNSAFAFQTYLDNVRGQMWDSILEKTYNIKVLSMVVSFPHDGWCGTKPVKTLEDWKGKVVWCGGPAEAEALTKIGASPVTMDWGDGYPAIEKGVVDGGTYGIGAAWMLKWSACKYYTLANFFVSAAGVGINKDVFEAMPKDLQDALVNAFKAHQARMVQFFGVDAPALAEKDLKAGGADVYHVPDSEIARWKTATATIKDSYMGKLSASDAKTLSGIMDSANANPNKY